MLKKNFKNVEKNKQNVEKNKKNVEKIKNFFSVDRASKVRQTTNN